MFLLLILTRNPVVFCRSLFLDFALARPREAYSRYISKYADVCQEAAMNLVHMGFDELRRKGILTGWYAAAHSIARLELYRADRQYALRGNSGLHAWRKLFGPITPGESQLHELAAVVNKATGHLSLSLLGISISQQRVESALFFPRYLRCLLGLVTDALQGRVRGNEARRIIAQAAVCGLAIYIAL